MLLDESKTFAPDYDFFHRLSYDTSSCAHNSQLGVENA